MMVDRMLTLKEAAEQTGKTKQAIQQAIKKGRISAHKQENGQWLIDPVELFRVYTRIKHIDGKNVDGLDDALRADLPLERELLRQKLTFLEEKLADKEGQLVEAKEREEKLQARLDGLTDTVSKQALMLEDLRQKPPEKPVGRFRWFWDR